MAWGLGPGENQFRGRNIMKSQQKRLGQFFTPPEVAATLIRWLELRPADRILDPSCGDGEFLALHTCAVGVEVDPVNAGRARLRAPGALIHSGDFFAWAAGTKERFEGAAGNPPFIRYQHFTGQVRQLAAAIAARLGADFNGLSSSWAPFLVAAATLLRPGGAMAFVVPAEIGHATYSAVLLECLCQHFRHVGILALREKLFPALSEDAWLLHCAGFGGTTSRLLLATADRFSSNLGSPLNGQPVTLATWRSAGSRLRKFLLSPKALALYEDACRRPNVSPLSDLAHAGIGYVTGANDFFHLRPSQAKHWAIPRRCLRVAIRRAEQLPAQDVSNVAVRDWLAADEPVLLMDLRHERSLPITVSHYLSTPDAERVQTAYKCRNRNPWYVVPDVRVPDAFLSYMSGAEAALVGNSAGCVCTNSVHAVRLKPGITVKQMQAAWQHPLAKLSCEMEGHPLGGGMLKLEPGEAGRVRLPGARSWFSKTETSAMTEATQAMRRWRHYD
jgi:hypothetical protein